MQFSEKKNFAKKIAKYEKKFAEFSIFSRNFSFGGNTILLKIPARNGSYTPLDL